MNARPKLLVADDNAALAGILKFNLDRAGYDVALAKNGQVAADLSEQEDFDLIVSDHQMPRMTGLEFCQFLRNSQRNSKVPFILLTAKAFELDAAALANELQIHDVIEKPFSPSSIVEIVNELLAPAN